MDKLPNPDLLTEFAKKHPNYHILHVNGQKYRNLYMNVINGTV